MSNRTLFKHRSHSRRTSRRVSKKITERIQAGRPHAFGAFANTVRAVNRIVAMLMSQLFGALLKSWRQQAASTLSYFSSAIGPERHAIISYYSTQRWCDSTERELNNALIGRGGWLKN